MAIALGGCANSGQLLPSAEGGQYPLAPVPEDLRTCGDDYPTPPGGSGPIGARKMFSTTAGLLGEVIELKGCNKRLLHLYDSQSSTGGKNG